MKPYQHVSYCVLLEYKFADGAVVNPDIKVKPCANVKEKATANDNIQSLFIKQRSDGLAGGQTISAKLFLSTKLLSLPFQ